MNYILLLLTIVTAAATPACTHSRTPLPQAHQAAERTEALPQNKPTDKPAAPSAKPELEVDSPVESPLGASLQGRVIIRNFDTVPRDFKYHIHLRFTMNNQDPLGTVKGPINDVVTIAAGGELVIPLDVPWSTIEPLLGAEVFDWLQFFVLVTRVHDNETWLERPLTTIGRLPLQITLTPSGRVAIGTKITATITYKNPMSYAVPAPKLLMRGDRGLPIDGVGREETITLPELKPGASGSITRTLTATGEGNWSFNTRLDFPKVKGETFESVDVQPATK